MDARQGAARLARALIGADIPATVRVDCFDIVTLHLTADSASKVASLLGQREGRRTALVAANGSSGVDRGSS